MPDSHHIAASLDDQSLVVWDVRTGLETFIYKTGQIIEDFDVSPIDGSIVYLPYDDPLEENGPGLQIVQIPAETPTPEPTPTK